MKTKKIDLIKVAVIFFISPFLTKVLDIPFEIALIMFGLWFLALRAKNKFFWLIIIFLVLILFNLYINRLLNITLSPLSISFDIEQSLFKYPGLRESIVRYKQEGLWLTYFLRNIFYSFYLIVFSWINIIFKFLSPLLWVKMIGFFGLNLMVLGIIHFFETKNKNYFMIWWFLLVIMSSSIRVLGDSLAGIYLTIPVIIYWWYLGFKSKYFKKYYIFWYVLFFIDLLLK